MSIGRSLVYMVRGRSTAKRAGSKQTPGRKTATTPKKRTTSKMTAPKRSASSKPMAAPKSAPSDKPTTMSKADFVRANSSLSVKDLVGKALFDGIDLTENYVYKVRRQDKLAAAKKAAAARKPYSKPTISPVVVKPVAEMKPADTKPAVTTPTTTQVEDLLRAVAAELGLGRAVEILAGERAKVRAVIGGE